MESSPTHSCTVRVKFPVEANATMVKQVLEVDEELQPTKINKEFRCEGRTLIVSFISTDPRVLRVALSSFYDMLSVALRTLLQFDTHQGV